MFKIKNLIIFLLLLVSLSCSENSTAPDSIYKVSGYVFYENQPVSNVSVSIDEKYNWTVKTDAEGFFEISSVSSGEHSLVIKTIFGNLNKILDDSSSFSEKTIEISVFDDLVLSNLKLPKAVFLFDANEITESSARISWSPTDDEDFREYKLYRHNSSGLDETTGTLVHVSTSLIDTIFTDTQLNPFENYYYRVYVMNEYGRIGGSNIMQLQTENVQLIRNGSFEELVNDKPSGWTLVSPNEGELSVDKVNSFEGNNSLKFYHAAESGCWETWTTQKINNSLLVPGERYKLIINFKADFIDDIWFRLILRNQTIDLWLDVPVSITNTDEWSEISYEFGLPENIGNNDIDMLIHFCIDGIRTWWVDNVSLIKTE